VDLFHGGYYYEAHEIWEALWHKVGHRTTPGWFLKALIQMAAVQLKLLSGDLKTAGRMNLRVRHLFEQVPSSIHTGKVFIGMDLLIQMAAVQLKLLSGDLKTAGRMTLRVRHLLEQVQSSIHPGKVFMGMDLSSLLKKIPDSGAPTKQGLRLDLKF